jgi:hypothetical protein
MHPLIGGQEGSRISAGATAKYQQVLFAHMYRFLLRRNKE